MACWWLGDVSDPYATPQTLRHTSPTNNAGNSSLRILAMLGDSSFILVLSSALHLSYFGLYFRLLIGWEFRDHLVLARLQHPDVRGDRPPVRNAHAGRIAV